MFFLIMGMRIFLYLKIIHTYLTFVKIFIYGLYIWYSEASERECISPGPGGPDPDAGSIAVQALLSDTPSILL